jgi:hypothetical protein
VGVLCSNVFANACEAEVRDYRVAFGVARLHPLEGDRYLGQLVSTLVERGDSGALCALPLEACGERVWGDVVVKTLMRKTEENHGHALWGERADNEPPTFYHHAYAFFVARARFNEAAKVMFLLAQRIIRDVEREARAVWRPAALQRLLEALQSSHSTLALVAEGARTLFLNLQPKLLWDDDGARAGAAAEDAAMEPRPDAAGDPPSLREKCVPVRPAEVEDMFLMAKWALMLLERRQAAAAGQPVALPWAAMHPQPLAEALVQAGEVDAAALLVLRRGMDASLLFQALTQRAADDAFTGHSWQAVQRLLAELDNVRLVDARNGAPVLTRTYRYHAVVLNTLLTLRPKAELPQWLVGSFLLWGDQFAGRGHRGLHAHAHAFAKQSPAEPARDPALLLRTLLQHGRLEDACRLAADLVAICAAAPQGHGAPPFLPLKTLDLVLLRCDGAERRGDAPVRFRHDLEQAIRDYATAIARAAPVADALNRAR